MEPKNIDNGKDVFSVLIVDDSAVVRRLLQSVLGELPYLNIIGTAKDGREAVEKTKELKPDFITLDVEMPNLSGLEALPILREVHREVAIIMISSLTARGAQETITALMSGASDYIQKPTQTDSRAQAIETLRDTLGPKLEALCQQKRARRAARGGAGSKLRQVQANAAKTIRESMPPVAKTSRPSIPLNKNIAGAARGAAVLAIGSSTGGPVALATLLSALPADFPLPIVIVQHMPATFTRLLADRLRSVSPFKVREAIDGQQLQPGGVWVAPGDQHLVVHRNEKSQLVLRLIHTPPVNSCRPSIDVLLESMATECKMKVLTVILTGMGSDGKRGCSAVHKTGGHVLVQDQESSVVWGMPGAVVHAGLAHRVLSLDDMANGVLNTLGAVPRGKKAS